MGSRKVKTLLLLLQFGFSLWVWWAKQDDEQKKKNAELKKEVDDAIKSGDVQRVNLLITRINGMR